MVVGDAFQLDGCRIDELDSATIVVTVGPGFPDAILVGSRRSLELAAGCGVLVGGSGGDVQRKSGRDEQLEPRGDEQLEPRGNEQLGGV